MRLRDRERLRKRGFRQIDKRGTQKERYSKKVRYTRSERVLVSHGQKDIGRERERGCVCETKTGCHPSAFMPTP